MNVSCSSVVIIKINPPEVSVSKGFEELMLRLSYAEPAEFFLKKNNAGVFICTCSS